MNCEDLEKAIKNIDELLEWNEERKRRNRELGRIADDVADVLDAAGLKPKFKKMLKRLNKLGGSLGDYIFDTQGVSDAEIAKRWRKARKILQEKYEECINPWTGKISCKITLSNPGRPGGDVISWKYTYKEEHTWEITGKPKNLADESFVDQSKGNISTYPVLWSGILSSKCVSTIRGILGPITTTAYATGQEKLETSLTIKIVGRRFTLMTPAGQAGNTFTVGVSNGGTTEVTGPMEVPSQQIEGRLDNTNIIKGTKGPVPNPQRLPFTEGSTWTKTIKWDLRRKKRG
jgi:hypothetical protein